MASFHNIILERAGDSRWYIKHTDISITLEQMIAFAKTVRS
jgi:hypothetical protein